MSEKEEMTFSQRTSDGICEGGFSRFNQNSREGIIQMIYYDNEEIVFEQEWLEIILGMLSTNFTAQIRFEKTEKLSQCKQKAEYYCKLWK